MDLRLRDKVVIVTGASLGIGAETAFLFAQEGAFVVLLDLDEENGKSVLERIVSSGGSAMFLKVDVSSETEVKSGIHSVVEKIGQIDVLINNAGIYRKGDVFSFSEDDFSRVVSVNVKGVLLCSKYAALAMKERNYGVIINVASEAGIVGIRNQIIYNLSKAAVISITKSCAVDLAPYGIRVSCVCPGTTFTPLVEKALSRERNPIAVRRELESGRPLNRLGTPLEIAAAILFLASDVVSYATGAVLSVDGGYTAW
ncbi:MAG: glucose 1-dehydrogenase [Atribacterota bacterium]